MLECAQGRAFRREKFLTNSNNKQRSGQRNRPKNNSTKMSKTSAPRYSMMPGGGMIISHREFVGVVNSEVIQTGQSMPSVSRTPHVPLKVPINPGDGRAFPWLNQIAVRFEKYTIRKLHYVYEPTCATTTSGGIALCPVYDPADPVPDSRTSLLNAEGVVRGAVHNELKLAIPSRRLRQNDTLFIRETHESLVDANELRLSDIGYVAIALSDATASLNYGDLFVEYTIELNSPRVGGRIGKCASITRTNFIPTAASGNAALFDSSSNGGPSVGSRLHHAPASTLMVDCGHTVSDFTLGGSDFATTEMTFREPFSGQLQIRGKTTSDSPSFQVMPYANRGDTVNVSSTKPWAITDLVQQVSSAVGAFTSIYNVVAEVGDVIQMSLGGITAGQVADKLSFLNVTLADLVPDLMPLLIL